MEEKKLTAEEIVKKLNYIKEQYLSYIYNDDDECKVLFVDDILDLIHRLQDENNQLKSPKFASWKLKFFRLKEEFDKELAEHEEFTKKAKAEIERLTEERNKARRDKIDLMYHTSKSETKNAELQKQVDELKERAKIDLENEKNWGKIQTKQAVKDTAKEICDLILEHWEKKQFVECDWLRVAISEKYGVEVE